MGDERITMADVRAAGLCCRGCKEWFRLRGLDFNDFLKNGIALSQIEHLNDALVDQVMASKNKRGGK